jgi:HK97 gp10 family phage protein
VANEFTITISGLEETLAMLEAAPKNIVKGAFGKALTAAAVPVVKAVEVRTPVHTGDLKEHLMTDIAVDANGAGGFAQVGFGNEGHTARLVEYGHRMIGHKPGKKELGTVPAHPFMRPAAAESAEAAVEAFGESLTESLEAGLKVA